MYTKFQPSLSKRDHRSVLDKRGEDRLDSIPDLNTTGRDLVGREDERSTTQLNSPSIGDLGNIRQVVC